MTHITLTASKAKRIFLDVEKIAGNKLSYKMIDDTLYIFGSELQCLRLTNKAPSVYKPMSYSLPKKSHFTKIVFKNFRGNFYVK